MVVADLNGSLKAGNGKTQVNGKANGQSIRKRSAKPRRGFFGWLVSSITRIATWAAILTILFRCPSSFEACDETSPIICKPYFRVKNAITPHVQPYYDHYAAPYVDSAWPYYETVNNRVLIPTRDYAVQYGTPWVNKGQDFALAQWEANGQPQLARLQAVSKAQYDQTIAPHVAKAGEIVGPYYDVARKHSEQTYNNYIVPGYEAARPYAVQGYNVATDFAVTTALPASYWAWNRANGFLDTAVWPQLRVVYVENVEPQLTRIGERLGRYKSRPTAKTPSEDSFADVTSAIKSTVSSYTQAAPESSSKPAANETPAANTETQATPASEATASEASKGDYWDPVQAPPAAQNESDKRKIAREMVAKDLETWQNKFAAQADEGAAAMEDQVDEIARAMMTGKAQTTGKGLVKQLEATIDSELEQLKTKISSIVAEGNQDAEAQAVSAVRSAGVTIKKKAQIIRGWRQDYDAELQETVVGAADVHFQILDETRSLALQQIGMRWAWTDGVTYKDWQKYHELKNTLNHWTEELKELIVTHPTLLEAQDASAQLEEEGMTTASNAAKELSRLKEVSQWKIVANDASENFDSDDMRLAAEAAQRPQETEETEAGNADEGDAGEAGAAPPVIINSDPESEATEAEPQVVLEGSAPIIIGGPADDLEPKPADDDTVTDEESEPEVVDDSVHAEQANTGKDYAETVSSAMFGAAAQSVADRKPILDVDIDEDSVASATNAAQSIYSSAVAAAADRYSSALSVVSAQVHGTAKPVHEQLFSSVSAAYTGAVAAASGKLNEAVAAASSGVYGAAPTPTKAGSSFDWQKVESIAAQRLKEGQLWAEIQYQSALIAIGAATPTPSSAPEKVAEQAKYHYYAALGLAQDRYQKFLAGASSAVSSLTATPTPTDIAGSASSMASAANEAAKSAYSGASEGVMSAASNLEDSISSVADAAGEQVVSAAEAVAGAWDVVVSQISASVYDEPTSAIGWYDSATDNVGSAAAAATDAVADSAAAASAEAAKRYDALNKFVSELVIGKEAPFTESAMSRLNAIYASATSNVGSVASDASAAAASVNEKIASAASQATEAVKETVQQIRDEL